MATTPSTTPTDTPAWSTPVGTGRRSHKKTREERELARQVNSLRTEREALQQKETEQQNRAHTREIELQKQIENLSRELEKMTRLGAALRDKNQFTELNQLEASTRDLVAQLGNARAKLEASIMTHPGAVPVARPPMSSPCRVEATVSKTDPAAIVARWDLGGIKPTMQDWVGLYIHDREFPNKYSLYFNTGGKAEGETVFSGLKQGTYDVRLFLAGTQVEQARSGAVLLGPAVHLHVKPVVGSSASHGPVRAFEVSWADDKKDSTPQDTKDWVAMFRAGTKSNKKWLAYQYCNAPAADSTQPNTLTFAAPRTAGAYEFRYFRSASGNIYSGKSESCIVPNVDFLELVVEEPGKVKWGCFSKEPSKWDWIGLFDKGDDSQKYLQCKYCCEGELENEEDADSGVVSFEMGQLPKGEYEVRYFSMAVGKYTPYKVCPLILQ